MTTFHLKGVKSFVKGGLTYHYLRRTGKRIVDPVSQAPIDPTTDLAAFVARVEAMKAGLDALPAPLPAKAGSLLDLIEAWTGAQSRPGVAMREASPEWQQLTPATRASYERIVDPVKGAIRLAIKRTLDQVPLDPITTPWVVKLRNKVAKRSGFWLGNYVVKVLRPLFGWAILYGHMTSNPAKGVPLLDRPIDMPVQHRSWAEAEYDAMYEGALERGWKGVALAFALGRYAGWALGDICHQPRSAWQDPRIAFVRRKKRKKRKVTDMQVPQVLAEALRKLAPGDNAPALVVNEDGEAYTENGLGTMIWRLNKDLADKGKVNMGLNIHGLRHSLGKQLYDLGLERVARKAVMSHDSDAASIVYERDGDHRAKADAAVVILDRSMRRQPAKKSRST